METNSFTPVEFICTVKNAFYFQTREPEIVVKTDSYGMTSRICPCWIQSNNDKFLFLNDDGELEAQSRTTTQQSQSDCKFNIHFYTSSIRDGRAGRAVMLYNNQDSKKKVVCCSDKREVYPEEMDLPSNIGENSHRAIFLRRRLTSTSDKFLFESSLYPSFFLAFELDKENPSLNKLVLRQKAWDEVDESCLMALHPIR